MPDLITQTSLARIDTSNIFTAQQTISRTSADLLTLLRDSNTVTNGMNLIFSAKDSTNAQTNYAMIRGEIQDETDTSEDGKIEISTMQAGTLTDAVHIWADGAFDCGGPNLRLRLKDTGLTAQRTPVWSNISGTIPMVGAKSGATTDINTTITETDILNYSVPANAIGANGIVRFRISGYILQNQVTGTTWRFRVKFGGTTMYDSTTASIPQDTSETALRIEGELYNKNATNAQGCSGFIAIGDPNDPVAGASVVNDDEITSWSPFDSQGNDAAIDTTSAQTLQVTVEHSVSDANVKTVIKNYIVEVIT